MGVIALADLPSHALSGRQRFDLCRSVMENRPYNPAIDGPYPKPTNSIGHGAYPPPGMNRIWIDFECSAYWYLQSLLKEIVPGNINI